MHYNIILLLCSIDGNYLWLQTSLYWLVLQYYLSYKYGNGNDLLIESHWFGIN